MCFNFFKNVSEINRRQHRNEDNCVKVMKQWEVDFLQHHFNKYVVLKIRIKCHQLKHKARANPLPILYLDMSLASWVLTDSSETHRLAFNTHTGKKVMLREDNTVGKGKRRRKALKPVCQRKASKRGTQRTPAAVRCTVAQRIVGSAPAGPEHHPGLSFGPALPFPALV